MKKTALLSLLLLVLGLVASAEAQLPPPAWAQSRGLYAGQTNLIGSVKVWNDDTTLYVYFDTTEVLLETHVHVGTDVSDIPQTKKGNPIPGQFDSAISYPDTHLHEFGAPFAGTSLVIAAHAAMGQADSMAIVSEPDAGTVEVSTTGPYTGYGSELTPVACWVHGNWPGISEATWISSAYYRETEGTFGSWRLFTRPFDVQGVVVDGATMTVNSDNVEDVAINDDWVGTSEYSTDWLSRVYGVGTVTYMSPYGWQQVKTYPLGVEPGANILQILMRNYPNGENVTGEGTAGTTANPTGLAYKLNIDYYVKAETAWGDGEPFEGRNWATYMDYTVMERRWDLTGTYVYHYQCVSGCSGTYHHDMVITDHDLDTGDFGGYGGYPAGSTYSITWIIIGDVDGDLITWYNIDYDLSSYLIVGTGTIASDGALSGDATAGSQVATWYADPGTATPVWGPPWP